MFNSIKPKQLFLIDGIGALVSAIFLSMILVKMEAYIGMPIQSLYFLAAIALILACYSMSCYAYTPTKWRPYLIVIAFSNALYCLLTLGLVIYFYMQLSLLGLAYFISEIVVIILLVRAEIQTVKRAS